MSRMPRVASGLLFALLALAGPAEARPSLWTTAREPRRARAEIVLVAAERMASHSRETRYEPSRRDFRRAALALLELAHAAELPDPRLHYLMAELLSAHERHEQARQLAEQALREDPDSPLAALGEYVAAVASAKLGDREREHAAYTRGLQIAWEKNHRANLYLNRAESSMTLGDFKAAVADYRRSIELAEFPDTQALGYWGLGVTLERSGDLPSGLEAIATAERLLPNALEDPNVFFVPAYEIHYYRALGAMAAARKAKTSADAKIDLESAVLEWGGYLGPAEPDGHRWVPNARLELARCERDLERGKRRAVSSQRKPALPSVPVRRR